MNKEGELFEDFTSAASRLNPPSCDREIYEPLGIEQPIFWYNIIMQQNRKGNITNYLEGRENTRNSPSFDASEADNTMFARLTSDDDAPDQVFNPDPEGNEGDDSGATSRQSRSSMLYAMVWSVAAASVFVFLG